MQRTWVLVLGFLLTAHNVLGLKEGDAASDPAASDAGASSSDEDAPRRLLEEGASWSAHRAQELHDIAQKALAALETGYMHAKAKLSGPLPPKQALAEGLCQRNQWETLVKADKNWHDGPPPSGMYFGEMRHIFDRAAEKPQRGAHTGALYTLGRCTFFAEHGKLPPEVAAGVQKDYRDVQETLEDVRRETTADLDDIKKRAATVIQKGTRKKLAHKKVDETKKQYAAQVHAAAHLFDHEDGTSGGSAGSSGHATPKTPEPTAPTAEETGVASQ